MPNAAHRPTSNKVKPSPTATRNEVKMFHPYTRPVADIRASFIDCPISHFSRAPGSQLRLSKSIAPSFLPVGNFRTMVVDTNNNGEQTVLLFLYSKRSCFFII